MIKLEKKNLGCPDQVVGFEHGRCAVVTLGGLAISQAALDPGWRWSAAAGPTLGAQERPAAHLAYVLRGRLMIETDGGDRLELGPGDIAAIPAGHHAWMVGDETCIVYQFRVPSAGAGQEPIAPP